MSLDDFRAAVYSYHAAMAPASSSLRLGGLGPTLSEADEAADDAGGPAGGARGAAPRTAGRAPYRAHVALTVIFTAADGGVNDGFEVHLIRQASSRRPALALPELGLEIRSGSGTDAVVITQVTPGSLAQTLTSENGEALAVGDVVRAVNGVLCSSFSQVPRPPAAPACLSACTGCGGFPCHLSTPALPVPPSHRARFHIVPAVGFPRPPSH